MTLYDHFLAALHDANQTAKNSYLQLLAPYIKEIHNASANDHLLADYCKKMTTLVQQRGLVLNGALASQFSQTFGEAHFASLCHDRGITLTKIPVQKNRKTPDFLHESPQQDLYFEVKTPSVVNGGRGINEDLQRSLDANIDIEQQRQNGKQIAIATSEVQPYANKPYQGKPLTAVISTLIEKTIQNIKSDQYINPNTFLVLNLCLIPPAITDNRTLRPAYCDDYLFPKAITGDLWMLAFAHPEMLVHGHPEFEGKPCIEGFVQKRGILADKKYDNISGLLIVTYPLGNKPDIYGLYRRSNYNFWYDKKPDLISGLMSLTGQNWNDDVDSNGWKLTGRDMPPEN